MRNNIAVAMITMAVLAPIAGLEAAHHIHLALIAIAVAIWASGPHTIIINNNKPTNPQAKGGE